METKVLKPLNNTREDAAIRTAAEILSDGGLVGLPTETVYGLAANAYDEAAVRAIFAAKGRPQDNPLIVHIAGPKELDALCRSVPEAARRLAAAFWPGPLTMVLPKSDRVSGTVSAGLDTVAVRMPSHPVARAVIEAAGVPLAAPSANLSGSPSPTTAAHVLADLDGRIPLILDGGACSVGVESTVLSFAGGVPRVLRPGGVTPAQIEAVLGAVEIDYAVDHQIAAGARVASPGMKYKHYAPKARVTIVDGPFEAFAAYLRAHRGKGVYALCFTGEETALDVPCIVYGGSDDEAAQARGLFAALRALDEAGAERVYARCPKKQGVALAVYNRLLRAAAFEVILL